MGKRPLRVLLEQTVNTCTNLEHLVAYTCANPPAASPQVSPKAGDRDTVSSPRQQVRKLVVDDRLHTQEIVSRMQGMLSRNTVKQYIKEIYGACRKEGILLAPIGPIPKECMVRHPHRQTSKSISPTHVQVGAQINRFRIRRGLDAPTFSRTLGFANQMSIRTMELGMHDFKLSELQRLTAALGSELSVLLQAPNVVGASSSASQPTRSPGEIVPQRHEQGRDRAPTSGADWS